MTPVACLIDDMSVLSLLSSMENPQEIKVHVSKVMLVLFGFDDASRNGFGSSFLRDNGILYMIGVFSYRAGRQRNHPT